MTNFIVIRNNRVLGLYNNETDALKRACNRIIDYISSGEDDIISDMNDPKQAKIAKLINDYIKIGDYYSAVDKWNYYIAKDEHFLHVIEKDVIMGADQPAPFADDFFTAIYNNQQSIQAVSNTPSTKQSAWVASKPGATCRGPHSSPEYNQYAYADQPDGTYLCQQCKLWGHVAQP